MPLPANGTTWPPPHTTDILTQLQEWDAWYVGDTTALGGALHGGTRTVSTFDQGGLVGVVKSFFWGRPVTPGQRDNRLHIPVAADIAQASADLLFSEPPTLETEDEGTQAVLDTIAADGLHDTLADAAELASALGGVYLIATTDPSIPHAFIDRADVDRAIPTFRWGRLQSVTFWTVLASEAHDTLRHIEVHELDEQGVGVIRHGLYVGTGSDLGRAVPLTDHPVTAPLAGSVDADSTISTGTPGLDVAFIPNLGPNRRWRKHPIGAHFGRSDLDGIEPLMDALDEVYSSLMRDVRLGKSMLIVPEYMLDNRGAGKGAAFAQEEVYAPLKIAPAMDAGGKPPVEQVQFAIRVEEHLRLASDLFGHILRSAGYSSQTFGESTEAAATATEVVSRERRSYITRDRKIRPFKPALEALLAKALAMDALVHKSKAKAGATVKVTFGDAIQESSLALAQTAQLLRAAEAASTKTLVAMNHPDWDDTQVDAEVAAIMAERGSTYADPDTMGEDGAGLPDAFEPADPVTTETQ